MVMLLGYFSRKTPPFAANICLGLFLAVYGAFMFYIPVDMHYLHYMAILFVVFISLALLIGRIKPETKPNFRDAGTEGVDMTPWKHFKTVSIVATLVMIGAYILLSPMGLVDAEREKTIEYGYIAIGIVIAFLVLILPILRQRSPRVSNRTAS
jgi:SSS family solute:Na+ symporter